MSQAHSQAVRYQYQSEGPVPLIVLKSIEKLRIALPAAIEWLLAEGYAFKIFE